MGLNAGQQNAWVGQIRGIGRLWPFVLILRVAHCKKRGSVLNENASRNSDRARTAESDVTCRSDFMAFHSAQCAALIAPYADWLRIVKRRTAVRNENALKYLAEIAQRNRK